MKKREKSVPAGECYDVEDDENDENDDNDDNVNEFFYIYDIPLPKRPPKGWRVPKWVMDWVKSDDKSGMSLFCCAIKHVWDFRLSPFGLPLRKSLFLENPELLVRSRYEIDGKWYIAYVDSFDKMSKRVHLRYRNSLESEWCWPTKDKIVQFSDDDEEDGDDNYHPEQQQENLINSSNKIAPNFEKHYYHQMTSVCST